MTRPAWRLIVRSTIHGFLTHGLADLAGSLTYFALLASAPGLVALISVANLFGQGRKAVDALLSTVDDVTPGSAVALLTGPLRALGQSPAIGWTLVVSVLLATWAVSSYVAAFGRSLNRIYEVREGRPIWKLKPFQLLVAVVLIVLVIITVAALVLSVPVAEGIGDAFGLGSAPLVIWSVAKWPVLVITVVLIVTVLNYATPNVRQPKIRLLTAGSAISVVVLVGVSLLFAFYVKDFADFDRTYRSFAGFVVVLLWLWISNLTLLFGAEFDAQFERARELRAGVEAERQIQLPPRETEASDRAARNREGDIELGRELREDSARDHYNSNHGE
ncbi:YihY/virulence factor BrkB family protein [Lacisediminihabitans sp. FW035]